MTSTSELPTTAEPQGARAPEPGAAPPAIDNPQQIRDLVCSDLAAVTDAQLLALVVAHGAKGRRKGPEAGKGWTAVGLARDVMAEAGGRFAELARKIGEGEVDWRRCGIGQSIGSRLIAVTQLAERWRRGRVEDGEDGLGAGEPSDLGRVVFSRRREPTDGERIAILLGSTSADIERARKLLHAYESPRKLLASFSLDAFEPTYRSQRVFMFLPGTDVEIEHTACCRLLAAVELARRHGGRVAVRPLEHGVLGLSSSELETLLDPANPLDPELRQALIEVLKTHPRLAKDFARLDRLAADAEVASYPRAAELHQMFEQLRRRRGWEHPAEVLGELIPYAGLLPIAAARIARARGKPARLLELQERLERAEQEAVAAPVARLVEALLALQISGSGAERALEEARRSYLARRAACR